MQIIFCVAVCIMPFLTFSQSEDTVFTVKLRDNSVRLLPESDVLYRGAINKFKLIKNPETIIDTILFSEGAVIIRDSILLIMPTKLNTGLLNIYVRPANGKSSLYFSKQFKVVNIEEPLPNLDGVSNDSAIHRMKAVAMGNLYLPSDKHPALKTKLSYPIVSFEMQTVPSEKMDTMKANGNKLTREMRYRIDTMNDVKGGGMLLFENIRYIGNSGDTLNALPLRVFLINDGINKF